LKQVQKTAQRQMLALTQTMQSSLTVLRMEPSALIALVDRERRRNPCLVVQNGDRFSAMDTTATIADEDTRADDLLRQIGLLRLSAAERALAIELVHCLDERGYLADTPDEICRYLEIAKPALLALVEKLQTLEPAGVFAWSLAGCFRLQLIAKNRFDPLIEKLLERLDLVAKQDVATICRLLDVDEEDAEDMLVDIRSLSPTPYEEVSLPFITEARPELVFTEQSEGSYAAALNADALPDLLTDDGLFRDDQRAVLDPMTLAYYRDCYRRAGDLVMALQKRTNTLIAIGEQIAARQVRYLRSGRPIDRAPLGRTEIANVLGMNKSTISRAIRGGFAETPFGVVDLAVFFTPPMTRNVETRTKDQALKRLQLIVTTEDAQTPLSDNAIAELMAKFGFKLSRRCIAKYRGLLSIPSSYQRRR